MRNCLLIVILALAAAGCATSGGAGGGQSTMSGDASKGAATAIAAKLGISESYVTTALEAAQSALGGGQKTADDKATAAQAGVDKAAAQAQTDGKPLTDDQKTGLLDSIKGLL